MPRECATSAGTSSTTPGGSGCLRSISASEPARPATASVPDRSRGIPAGTSVSQGSIDWRTTMTPIASAISDGMRQSASSDACRRHGSKCRRWTHIEQHTADGQDGGVAAPDLKPPPRIRDRELLVALHHEWRECALCMGLGFGSSFEWIGLSLHHVCKHPRDDVRGNLVMLCGDGTRGCHGLVEARDAKTLRWLGEHIIEERPDILEYLAWRKGETAWEWFRLQFGIDSPSRPGTFG